MSQVSVIAVDDEFPVLYTIEAVLEEEFEEIATFTDPEEAIAFVRQNGCRVVITDLSMPRINGLQLLDEVLAIDEDIQVVMLTAHGSEKIAVEAMEKGAFYYITKPFDPEELKLVTIKGLNEYRNRKEILYDQELARTLQKNLLPQQAIRHPDFTISFHYSPGGIVGGDYFDFLYLPDGSLGIIMADAMGHGVSSAMIMAMLKMVFMNLAPEYEDPAELLGKLNEQFYGILRGRSYFTAFYAIIRNDPYRMICASAGHPFPIFYRRTDDREITHEVSGLSIGMFPKAEYNATEIHLTKGDYIFFYTDGILDLKDNQDFFIFFKERFCELARKGQTEILDELRKILEENESENPDDRTMLLLQY
jgi:sigma-B regulation protein RsbU (phosphoserine phosphatase)